MRSTGFAFFVRQHEGQNFQIVQQSQIYVSQVLTFQYENFFVCQLFWWTLFENYPSFKTFVHFN